MRCPACEEELSRADYQGQQLARCASCGGSWLSGGGFSAVCSMDGAGFSPRDVAKLKILAQYKVEKTVKPTNHPCPRCGKKLKSRNFANIAGFFVEQCASGCGVWVREGDLDRIRILRSLGVSEEVRVKKKEGAKTAPEAGQPAAAAAETEVRTPPVEEQGEAAGPPRPEPAKAASTTANKNLPPASGKRQAAKAAGPSKTPEQAPTRVSSDAVRAEKPAQGFFSRLFSLLFRRKP